MDKKTFIRDFDPCDDGLEWMKSQKTTSLNKLWSICHRPDWLIYGYVSLRKYTGLLDDKAVIQALVYLIKEIQPDTVEHLALIEDYLNGIGFGEYEMSIEIDDLKFNYSDAVIPVYQIMEFLIHNHTDRLIDSAWNLLRDENLSYERLMELSNKVREIIPNPND